MERASAGMYSLPNITETTSDLATISPCLYKETNETRIVRRTKPLKPASTRSLDYRVQVGNIYKGVLEEFLNSQLLNVPLHSTCSTRLLRLFCLLFCLLQLCRPFLSSKKGQILVQLVELPESSLTSPTLHLLNPSPVLCWSTTPLTPTSRPGQGI
jgi:hypothetical protein